MPNTCTFCSFSLPAFTMLAGMISRGAMCFTAGFWEMSSTSGGVRPRRRRNSSGVMLSPGPQGRTNTTEEPRLWICLAIDSLRPDTMALMPVTVVMPMTTPRMVSPARIL